MARRSRRRVRRSRSFCPSVRKSCTKSTSLTGGTFAAAFSVAGLDLVESKDFSAHLTDQAGATKRLTTGDKAHLALYGELVLKKRVV